MNGDRTILSDSITGSGATSSKIIGIGLEPNGDIVVANADLNALFRVDRVTGAREIFSSSSVGTGPDFHAGFGVVVFLPEFSSFALASIGLLAWTLILGSGVVRRRVRTHYEPRAATNPPNRVVSTRAHHESFSCGKLYFALPSAAPLSGEHGPSPGQHPAWLGFCGEVSPVFRREAANEMERAISPSVPSGPVISSSR